MSADTPIKRYSGINITSPWRGLNVIPGVSPSGERQAVMFMYSGILAEADAAPPVDTGGIQLPAVLTSPVDFVIQSPLWRQGFVDFSRPVSVKAVKQDDSELREIMSMYEQWKRAA